MAGATDSVVMGWFAIVFGAAGVAASLAIIIARTRGSAWARTIPTGYYWGQLIFFAGNIAEGVATRQRTSWNEPDTWLNTTGLVMIAAGVAIVTVALARRLASRRRAA